MSCIIIFQIKVMIRIIMTSNLNQQEIIRFLGAEGYWYNGNYEF